MMDGERATNTLSSSLPGWDFIGFDALGCSKGLILGWKSSSL
jgi:hypothetical protein